MSKFQFKDFEDIFKGQFGFNRDTVIAGPAFGVDNAVVKLDEKMKCIASSDPVFYLDLLGIEKSAWLSVQYIANDISTSLSRPQYAIFNLNIPDNLGPLFLKKYWDKLHQSCNDTKISIIGGHTTYVPKSRTEILGSGTFFSFVDNPNLLLSKGAEEENGIFVTKSSALSAALILAQCFPNLLKSILSNQEIDELHNQFKSIAITDEIQQLSKLDVYKDNKGLNAIHDVTEYGVLGAIYEICCASGCGAEIIYDNLPLNPLIKKVTDFFNINPYYSEGAGALILTCAASFEHELLDLLTHLGIQCVRVGTLKPKSKGISIIKDDKKQPLSLPKTDPYIKAYENAKRRFLD